MRDGTDAAAEGLCCWSLREVPGGAGSMRGLAEDQPQVLAVTRCALRNVFLSLNAFCQRRKLQDGSVGWWWVVWRAGLCPELCPGLLWAGGIRAGLELGTYPPQYPLSL